MQRFQGIRQRDEDEYEEEYDEYEEDASEEEEEEEEEREEPVSQDVQDFLKSREVLKEKIRQKLKKETAAAFGHQSLSQEKRTPKNDTFGSFFGPSKPVIASRVIEERRSIKETQHIVSRAPSSSTANFKDAASTSSGQKTLVHHHKPKVVDEFKKKAQTLKDMRDYSFLLSDDADIPSPAVEQRRLPASSNASTSKPDVRSAYASSKSRAPMEASSKSRHAPGASFKSRPPMPSKVSNGHELKNSASKNVQSQTRVAHAKGAPINKPRPQVAEARKSSGGNTANGSGRPVGRKDLPSNRPAQATSTDRVPSRGANDPGLKRRPLASGVPHSSTQKNHYSEQRRPSGGVDRVKPQTQRPLPPSKSASKPQKQIPHRDVREEQPKKKPVKRRFDGDDDEDAIGMIRKMFGYNPNKYAGMDEDDSDMEADFRTIEMEERRSSKIAREEDEEQLRLIEEEEERQRMRKKQKQIRR